MSAADGALEWSGLGTPGLRREFQERMVALLRLCQEKKLNMGVGATLRHPKLQGWMWCRTKTREEVRARWQTLVIAGAPRMAQFLREEWAEMGPCGSDHLPGNSWHQHGEAADIFLRSGPDLVWRGGFTDEVSELAQRVGLHHARSYKNWSPMLTRQWHVQLQYFETPLLSGFATGWRQLDDMVAEKFPDLGGRP